MAYNMADLGPLSVDLQFWYSEMFEMHLRPSKNHQLPPASLLWPNRLQYIYMPEIFVAVVTFYTIFSEEPPLPHAKGPHICTRTGAPTVLNAALGNYVGKKESN